MQFPAAHHIDDHPLLFSVDPAIYYTSPLDMKKQAKSLGFGLETYSVLT